MLKAIGKNIDTMPIQRLLSQEEARTDTVTIEVDRFHGTHDLSEFSFMMRGITESGGEAEAFLHKTVEKNVIRLEWEIGPAFTKEAGTLSLDLLAYRYAEEAEPGEDAPDYLLRYQLPAIEIRALPDGSHVLDEQSYTAFLLQVRETAERFLAEIADKESAVWEEIRTINREILEQRMFNMGTETNINSHNERITAIENTLVKIVILTESEYAALEEKDAKTLYVVKEDE